MLCSMHCCCLSDQIVLVMCIFAPQDVHTWLVHRGHSYPEGFGATQDYCMLHGKPDRLAECYGHGEKRGFGAAVAFIIVLLIGGSGATYAWRKRESHKKRNHTRLYEMHEEHAEQRSQFVV